MSRKFTLLQNNTTSPKIERTRRLGSVTELHYDLVNISELQKKMVNCVWCLEA